jgi:hypothetical protein
MNRRKEGYCNSKKKKKKKKRNAHIGKKAERINKGVVAQFNVRQGDPGMPTGQSERDRIVSRDRWIWSGDAEQAIVREVELPELPEALASVSRIVSILPFGVVLDVKGQFDRPVVVSAHTHTGFQRPRYLPGNRI